MNNVREFLRDLIAERGVDMAEASRAIGKNPTYVQQFVKYGKPAKLPEDARQALASFLGVDEQRLRNAKPSQPEPTYEGYRPAPILLGKRDLPIFAAVEGGPGEFVYDSTPIEVVPRPWYVSSVSEAFGVHVVGESMVPVIRPGQIVVVNPKLGPIPGEVAIYVSRAAGEFKATIKEHRRSTAEHWHVYQYNPPSGQDHDFTLSKRDWAEAIRVVGWFAGR